jgi:hypothetical protein
LAVVAPDPLLVPAAVVAGLAVGGEALASRSMASSVGSWAVNSMRIAPGGAGSLTEMPLGHREPTVVLTLRSYRAKASG